MRQDHSNGDIHIYIFSWSLYTYGHWQKHQVSFVSRLLIYFSYNQWHQYIPSQLSQLQITLGLTIYIHIYIPDTYVQQVCGIIVSLLQKPEEFFCVLEQFLKSSGQVLIRRFTNSPPRCILVVAFC